MTDKLTESANALERSPTILLIVATFNCASTLRKCLESFVAQTYPHKKIIIIDGGSVDGTVDIIKSYEDHIAYWVSEPDKGIYDAWNKALKAPVEWDWVQFMGGDDYFFDDNVLEFLACKLDTIDDSVALVYSKTVLDYKNGIRMVLGEEFNRKLSINKGIMPTGQVSMFYKKIIFSRYGDFNVKYFIAGDLEHFIRVIRYEEPVYIGDIISTVHKVGGISSTNRYAYTRFKERELALSDNGYKMKRNLYYFYVKLIRLAKQKIFYF